MFIHETVLFFIHMQYVLNVAEEYAEANSNSFDNVFDGAHFIFIAIIGVILWKSTIYAKGYKL